jgi:hypothetical protein
VLKNKLWEILFLTYEDRFEEGEGGGREPGWEMAQTMYAHMKKWIKKNKENT